MSFNLKVGGTWQTLASGWVKVSGTWQQVASAWVKVSGTWQQVYSSLSASADKASVSGSGSDFSACGDPGNTDTVTVTPSGGKSPYTYAWARVGAAADSGPYQANAATSAATAFSDVDSTVCTADINSDETWRCTVTDDNSQTATVDVTVTLTWTDLT